MKTFLAVIATVIIGFVTVGLIYQIKEVKTKIESKQTVPTTPPVDEKKVLERQVQHLATENEKYKDSLKKKDRDLKDASSKVENVKKETQEKEKALGELQKKVSKIENEKDDIKTYAKVLEDNVKTIKSENAEVKDSVKNLESRLMDIFTKKPEPAQTEEKKPAIPPSVAEEKTPAKPEVKPEAKAESKPDLKAAERMPLRKTETAQTPAQPAAKAEETAASKPAIPASLIEEKPKIDPATEVATEAPGPQLALAPIYTYSLTREAPGLTVNQELEVTVANFNYSNVDIELKYGGLPPQTFAGKEAGDEITYKNYKIVVYQIHLDGADLYIKRR
jgi:myosin heavy subunit